MTTKEKLEQALKTAMRAQDELSKRTLRMALSAIRLAEVEKGGPLEENAVLALLQKEIKSRQEAIAEAQKAGRPDLQAASQAEIGVLQAYLPQAMPESELEALVRLAIHEAGATSERDMGKIMRVLMPRLQGRATGDQANQMVRKLLQTPE